MSKLTAGREVTCTLNGSPVQLLHIESETSGEEVRSLSSVKPDPKWQQTDTNGHYHAYSENGDIPTLRSKSETYWCADCQDHHTNYIHVCQLCGEEIQPKTIDSGPTSTWIAGPTTWTLHTKGPLNVPPEGLSVHINRSDLELFGIVYLVSQTISSDYGARNTFSGHLHPRLAR